MQPIASDMHVNQPLSNVAVAFMQGANRFIASQVFPNIPVDKQSDLYYVWDRTDFNRVAMQKRAPATESAGSHYRVSTSPYFADVWALHKDIDDQTRANADAVFSQDKIATEYLTQQALLRKELSFATNFMVTGVWGTDITG